MNSFNSLPALNIAEQHKSLAVRKACKKTNQRTTQADSAYIFINTDDGQQDESKDISANIGFEINIEKQLF